MNPKLLLSILLVLTLVLPAVAAKKNISDNAIHDSVMRKLADDQVVKTSPDVDVKDGVVTLKGSVEYDIQKSRAEKLTKKVAGVKSVINQITVRRPGVKAPQ
jgi:hyperosmotically inducible periplasmic protein